MNNLYILGYSAINYFKEWYQHENYPNTTLRIVDNNNQAIPKYFQQNVVYTTRKNIGCAGGWNLICDIGFKHFNLDTIIIGQEDARFSEEILDAITEHTTPGRIVGTYNNSFEFSLFGIHRDTFNKVGRFDENFIYAGCEDNDYKYRCKVVDVDIISLGVPHSYNANATTYEGSPYIPNPIRKYNENYVHTKWGHYTYSSPFNGQVTKRFTDAFKEVYGDLEQWPSELEYNTYTSQNENSISQ
jgi:hypothetical protein